MEVSGDLGGQFPLQQQGWPDARDRLVVNQLIEGHRCQWREGRQQPG